MDAKSMKFEGFKSGALLLNESNFGLTHAHKGVVTTSWNSDRAISVAKNEVLFILTFSVQQNTTLSKAIMINSDITAVAAYDAQLTEMNVELGLRNGPVVDPTSIFELYQNNPNPFDKQTSIQFTLPESMPAVLTIYDVTGKVVYKTNLSGQKGVNLIHIAKQELNASGVLYYQLDASGHTATKRMILIE
jgi:hypothetical protein